MYLSKIVHDFDFDIDLNIESDEILNTLVFQKIKKKNFLFLFSSKINFHTNQGRKTYLKYYIKRKKYIYQFTIEDIITFYWEEGSKEINYKIYKSSNSRLIKYWLLHTFLPLYYMLERKYGILHVGTVDIRNKAILFAAPSFGGKSTLTNYFLTKGHKLLSDDKLAYFKKKDRYYAIPSYPYARNYRALEDLGVYIDNFSTRSLPMENIYYLKLLDNDKEIYIKNLRGIEKFMVIEMSHDMKLSCLKEEQFRNWNSLVDELNIYEIGVPKDISKLDLVYQKIILHCK